MSSHLCCLTTLLVVALFPDLQKEIQIVKESALSRSDHTHHNPPTGVCNTQSALTTGIVLWCPSSILCDMIPLKKHTGKKFSCF